MKGIEQVKASEMPDICHLNDKLAQINRKQPKQAREKG